MMIAGYRTVAHYVIVEDGQACEVAIQVGTDARRLPGKGKRRWKMATIKAKLVEKGNGLPSAGELVYHHDSDQLYRVIDYSGIHTDGYRGNYVYANLRVDDETTLTEKEYDSFSVDVELLADE